MPRNRTLVRSDSSIDKPEKYCHLEEWYPTKAAIDGDNDKIAEIERALDEEDDDYESSQQTAQMYSQTSEEPPRKRARTSVRRKLSDTSIVQEGRDIEQAPTNIEGPTTDAARLANQLWLVQKLIVDNHLLDVAGPGRRCFAKLAIATLYEWEDGQVDRIVNWMRSDGFSERARNWEKDDLLNEAKGAKILDGLLN
ncbi:hypothetical protein JAAARDRAFT_44320 [Jaapia argillacea MUCL 33604]|uniref:Uncharacterized protein n=1 Tax=Jaapia argillacea MUCL 33604 TaxID=933084 RepID=A0A067Q944_9AGAM|nr:hypothetical protein JAAARDRAFT_44320 [Jaapia argillacea MUCL 33604]